VVGVDAAAGIVDEEVVVVNATTISTKGMVVNRGITKIHEMARMAEAGIMGEGDTTNLRVTPTLPQLNPRVIRTGGTHHKAAIRTINKAGSEDHLSHHMTRGLRLNNLPMEVAEEGTIPAMITRTAAGRMGMVEGEEALLPREGEVPRTVAVDMGIREVREVREVREGGTGTAATVVDTTSPHRTAVTEAVTTEAVVIALVEAINPVEVTRPAARTVPVSSLMETKEGTTREVEGVGEGIDRTDTGASIKMRLRFVSSIFSSCFESTFGDIPPVILGIYYVQKHFV
jgi:hypothetical protein